MVDGLTVRYNLNQPGSLLFSRVRNFNLIAQYWLVSGTDCSVLVGYRNRFPFSSVLVGFKNTFPLLLSTDRFQEQIAQYWLVTGTDSPL